MTKDEALRMALKALEKLFGTPPTQWGGDVAVWRLGGSYRTQQAITAIKQALAAPVQEPVGWISNKDFEPIRIRIMQEAYELADNNDPEGYNAIKVMCGDVQKMLSPQRTWVGLTDEEVNQLYTQIQEQVDKHWTDGGTSMMFPTTLYKAFEAKLKQKNGYAEEKNT